MQEEKLTFLIKKQIRDGMDSPLSGDVYAARALEIYDAFRC